MLSVAYHVMSWYLFLVDAFVKLDLFHNVLFHGLIFLSL
jgi:hypothetical protein